MKNQIEVNGYKFECEVQCSSVHVDLIEEPTEFNQNEYDVARLEAAGMEADLDLDQLYLVEADSCENIFHIIK